MGMGVGLFSGGVSGRGETGHVRFTSEHALAPLYEIAGEKGEAIL
jgi:hypothetical protein